MKTIFQFKLTHVSIDYEKPRHSDFSESHNDLLFDDEELAFQDIKKHFPEFMRSVVFGTPPSKVWKDGVENERRDNMYSREPFKEPDQPEEWKSETWAEFLSFKKCENEKDLRDIMYEIQDVLTQFDEGSTIRLGKDTFKLFEKGNEGV